MLVFLSSTIYFIAPPPSAADAKISQTDRDFENNASVL
jgi:hypothetical protein